MIKCDKINYRLLADNNCQQYFPYLRNCNGQYESSCLSPIHGRSLVVGTNSLGKYIVTKGNGLTYSEHAFLHTPELPTDVWGLLRQEDALRDFYCCLDVQKLGIKTNHMECVMELEPTICIPETGEILHPNILQYNVECPFRISDAGFIKKDYIHKEVSKWEGMNEKGFSEEHLIAANVLIKNLRVLHDNGILHNALTPDNLTWALELVDFELCHTPLHPYTQDDCLRHISDVLDREVIDIYRLIIYIAGVIEEPVNFGVVDDLFKTYGFDLVNFKLNIK